MREFYESRLLELAVSSGVSLETIAKELHGYPETFVRPIAPCDYSDCEGIVAGIQTATATFLAPTFAAVIGNELQNTGVDVHTSANVVRIHSSGAGFCVYLDSERQIACDQIVLAAGHDSFRLAKMVGASSPSGYVAHMNLATYVKLPDHIRPGLVFSLLGECGGMCCPIELDNNQWLAMLYWPSKDGSQIATEQIGSNFPSSSWQESMKSNGPDEEPRAIRVLEHLRSIYPFLKDAELHHWIVRSIVNPLGPVREVRRFCEPSMTIPGVTLVLATKATHLVRSAIEAVRTVQAESLTRQHIRERDLLLPFGLNLSRIPSLFSLKMACPSQEDVSFQRLVLEFIL